MKSKIKYSIFAVLLVLLLATAMHISLFVYTNIPNATEFHRSNPDIPSITLEDIKNFRLLNSDLITYSTVKPANIYTPSGQADSINAVFTDKYYKELYNLKILYGHFFTIDGAVISKQLSQRIFNTADGIGYTVFIDNKSYTVVGIYEDNNFFCKKRVYLPSKENINADVVVFKGDKQFEYYVTLFNNQTAYKFNGYMGVGLIKEMNIIKIINNIILSVLTIVFTVKMMKINAKLYKEMRDGVSLSLSENYYFDTIKLNKKIIAKFISVMLLSTAILIFLLTILAKPISFPLDFTTKNIFDFKFFKNAISKRLSWQYDILNPICGYWMNYIRFYLNSYLLVLACLPIIFSIKPSQKNLKNL